MHRKDLIYSSRAIQNGYYWIGYLASSRNKLFNDNSNNNAGALLRVCLRMFLETCNTNTRYSYILHHTQINPYFLGITTLNESLPKEDEIRRREAIVSSSFAPVPTKPHRNILFIRQHSVESLAHNQLVRRDCFSASRREVTGWLGFYSRISCLSWSSGYTRSFSYCQQLTNVLSPASLELLFTSARSGSSKRSFKIE